MKRSDALNMIGKPVKVWTSLWGEYIGILENISDTTPFRADVKILAVLKYPHVSKALHENKMTGRKPLKYNFVINVGAVNVQPYDGFIPDYCESLKLAIEASIKEIEDCEIVNFKSVLGVLEKHKEILIPERCEEYRRSKE